MRTYIEFNNENLATIGLMLEYGPIDNFDIRVEEIYSEEDEGTYLHPYITFMYEGEEHTLDNEGKPDGIIGSRSAREDGYWEVNLPALYIAMEVMAEIPEFIPDRRKEDAA